MTDNKYTLDDLDDCIIVGVWFRGTFDWYVTNVGYWFMDEVRYDDDFKRAGYVSATPSLPGQYRFGIAVLDERTAERFLTEIESEKATTFELCDLVRQALASPERDNDLIGLVPALLVNFDTRRLLNQFSEPVPFERYAPAHWHAEYRIFTEEILPEHRYWVVDGANVLD